MSDYNKNKIMMMKTKFIFLIYLSILLLYSCDRRNITRTDTETSGNAIVASDECFTPILKEELNVFTGLNPEATISPIFTDEKELFSLLLKDSIRMIIAARELTDAEQTKLEEKKLTVRSQKIARDGIALIINKANPDSMINIQLLEKIMTGEISDWAELNPKSISKLGVIKVVFDHPSSSTVRFISENIVSGKQLSSKLRALGSNQEVLSFVARTPNALGVVGVNWISNPNDSTQLSFDKTIRVMAVGITEKINENTTCKPYPVFLNNGNYPLTRDVYAILSDLRGTLPAGFVKFIAGDSGQRIILKAGLVPGTRPTREIYIKEDF